MFFSSNGSLPTFWFTGLSGAGKTTLAQALTDALILRGWNVELLDGDAVRRTLSADLGFSREDRREQLRRVALRCHESNMKERIVVAALISPYRADRAMACDIIGADSFLEIYLSTPLHICEARDPKGLYQRARRREIPLFTGLDDPYEPPMNPALNLDTSVLDVPQCLQQLLSLLPPP